MQDILLFVVIISKAEIVAPMQYCGSDVPTCSRGALEGSREESPPALRGPEAQGPLVIAAPRSPLPLP